MKIKNSTLKNELNPAQKVIAEILMLINFILMALPMWNVLVLSTSTSLSASASGIKLWWDQFSLEGYRYVFEVTKLGRPFLNSLFVTAVSIVIEVILSSFAGYVTIQRELPGRRAITSFVMFTMMVPGDLTLVSIYQANKQFHLLNSYLGLIVNGLISGFAILLMRNYFLSVPVSLAESARLDGASEFQIFLRIYLPISTPGLATVFFIEFVSKWNSIMLPATLVTDQKLFTLPLMLKAMILQVVSQSGADITPPNASMAAVVISTIPLLLIYIFAQRYLLTGMTLGSSKE